MADSYSIDLSTIPLSQFRRMLETKALLPQRQILLDDIEARFELLAEQGIASMQDLWNTLRTNKHVAAFAEQSRLPEHYVRILRREVGSYRAKPVNLDKLPGVAPEHVVQLAAEGIKHTKHLFLRARTAQERANLAAHCQIPESDLLELARLSDLVRVGGMGPAAAELFASVGLDTTAAILEHSPEAILERIASSTVEGGLGLKDIEYIFETARLLPPGIELDT